MRYMVTRRKIAELCGVSTATVSKALNHETDISGETARRIREAASKMGYQPNSAARALKTRHTHNIGMLTALRDRNGMAHEFVAQIISAFQENAEEHGYDVTLLSDRIIGHTAGYLEHCRYRGFDGVAVITADMPAPMIRELLESEIPSITVDAADISHGCVITDNESAMRELVGYAFEQGHRKIAFIHGEASYITRVRVASFRRTYAEHGLDMPESYLREAFYNDGATTASAVRELLALPDPPTCILFPDDCAYVYAQRELETLGCPLPPQLGVAGFDGVGLVQAMRPRLTTYWQDAESLGKRALLELLEAVEAPKTYLPRRLLIPGRLVRGETIPRLG